MSDDYKGDIERSVAKYLLDETGIQAYIEVPQEPADEYLSVELTGSSGNPWNATYHMDIDCVAGQDQRRRARELAYRVQRACHDLDTLPCVFNPTVSNIYRMNDPDTRRSRYVVQLDFVLCD